MTQADWIEFYNIALSGITTFIPARFVWCGEIPELFFWEKIKEKWISALKKMRRMTSI